MFVSRGEAHKSLEEAKDMIEKLNRQVTSLEAVQKGEALPAPVPVAVPEPVVKIVEVKNCLYYLTIV